jgi:polyisoprenyl-phosphate glycosyltransferase
MNYNYNLSDQQKSAANTGTTEQCTSSADHSMGKKSHRPLLSIIIPVYNEQEVLENCHLRLEAVANNLPLNTEIIYINDGSNDNSLQILQALRKKHTRIAIIDLSRNFGKEIAMTAGLDHAKGDAVIILDADLQDPPELIPEMLTEWQCGYDIVYMKRASRQGESWLKKLTAHTFYRLIARISHIDIPQGVGDFRLLSRRAVDSLCQLRESNRFMKGLFA